MKKTIHQTNPNLSKILSISEYCSLSGFNEGNLALSDPLEKIPRLTKIYLYNHGARPRACDKIFVNSEYC